MTHLRLSEVGDLKLVVENLELTGQVKNVVLATDFEYDDVEWGQNVYRTAEKYTITAEFVPNEKGHAYAIKEPPKIEPITYTAETVLGVENWNDKGVKAARKRVGAPKGSAYFIYSENQSPATIKFTWTQES